MSMLKEILIEEIFEFPSIKGITQKFINDNKGDIPVYGGKKSGIAIGYVKDNLEDVKYFEDCLTWNRNGSTGYVFIRKEKFTTTDDHRPLIVKEEVKTHINYNYLRYILQEKLISNGFCWGNKAGKEKLRLLNIPIPVKEDGSFDLEKQKEIASRYEKIEMVKNSLKDKMNMLVDSSVLVDLSQKNIIEINLEKIIDFKKCKTNDSKFTKKFINDNKGDIPVFGASKFKDIPSYGYIKDDLEDVKYFEDCLTWNIDGSIACFYREGKFSLSEKVIPIYLKEEYKDLVDLEYLSYLLREKAIEHGFSREFKPNQSKLRNISISIPIKEDGSFDLENQKEIASRYEKIENIKSSLKDKMNMLVDSDVLID